MPLKTFQIELPLGIMFPTVNCYLIPGEQLTLIDAGLNTPESWNLFQGKLKNLGYQVSDIEQVILTHEHRDHIGLIPFLLESSEAIIRVPKMIKEWFTQPKVIHERYQKFSTQLFSTLGVPEEKLRLAGQIFEKMGPPDPISAIHRFEFFEAGAILNFGGKDWEALNTPGHCLSQMIFHQKEEHWVFGSDMLLPKAPLPIIEPTPHQPKQGTRALKNLIQSFERLKKLNFQMVYPGHGTPFTNANQVIDQQLARIQKRKEECFEAINSGAKTPFQIKKLMYPYQSVPPDFSGLFMILGYSDLLLEEGRISKAHNTAGHLFFNIEVV